VISFVTREMGLMVKRGNPLKIGSLRDVVERKARFVNRDHDSGTRQHQRQRHLRAGHTAPALLRDLDSPARSRQEAAIRC
jgi:molybdate-binding protein